MKENDIARKCAASLLGVAGLVFLLVLASHWISFSGSQEPAGAKSLATLSPVASKPKLAPSPGTLPSASHELIP